MKIAVRMSGRQWPSSVLTMARISSGVGMSTPTLSLPFCRLSARASLPPPASAQGAHHVLSDQAALLRVGQDGAERAADLAHHGRRAVERQLVLEGAHHRRREA